MKIDKVSENYYRKCFFCNKISNARIDGDSIEGYSKGFCFCKDCFDSLWAEMNSYCNKIDKPLKENAEMNKTEVVSKIKVINKEQPLKCRHCLRDFKVDHLMKIRENMADENHGVSYFTYTCYQCANKLVKEINNYIKNNPEPCDHPWHELDINDQKQYLRCKCGFWLSAGNLDVRELFRKAQHDYKLLQTELENRES